MSNWPATKARLVLAALLRIGWSVKRTPGSHRVREQPGWSDFVFAFHDGEEIGPPHARADRAPDRFHPEDL